MKKNKNPEKTKAETLGGPATDNIAENNGQSTPEMEPAATTPKLYTEEEYQLKVNELNDKYLRLHAEFDNFRKRTLREKIELSRTASEEMIRELLPVLDDFDRALASMKETDKIEAVKEGVEHIQAKMKNIFVARGLQEMKTTGEAFNTDFHEAITSTPAPTEDLKNKVVEEVQKGYLLYDKVIRFAKVVIGS